VPAASRKSTILIVEDDPGLRTFYRTILTLEGYSVVMAEDGIDALQRFDEQEVGAVILDLGLPRLRGEDVGREIASHRATRPVPIIVVTGSDTRHLNPDLYTCMLKKPITAEELLRAVKTCLRDA
jgi:two-component system response regulator MprA